MWDYLPEEILIKILVKLPAKSLIRGMSVCKQWRCLIRSPSFISTHLSNSTQNQALFRRYDYHDRREHYTVIPKRGPFAVNSSPELEFPFEIGSGLFRILGSCDGLVCLYDSSSRRIIIWNPAIRNHLVLPQPLLQLLNLSKHYCVVLGFGVASNVYKVVRLVYCLNPNEYDFIDPPQAEVFSLGTGRWGMLSGFDVRVCVAEHMWSTIFFKGFVHWIVHEPMSEHSVRNYSFCNSILRFHVGDEVFGETMLPQGLETEPGTRTGLAIMGESLGVIKIYGEMGILRHDVWIMKDYGVKESWTRLYRIDFGFERVVGFWGSSEVLMALHRCELVIYNPETKGINHVGVFGNTRSFYVDDYKESLVLLGGYIGDSGEEVSEVQPLVLLRVEKLCGGMKTIG